MANFRSLTRSMLVRTAVLAFILFLGLSAVQLNGQQVDASWNPGNGKWSVSTNWTPGAVPNNGGGTTFSVTIAGLGESAVVMDVLNDTIDNLTLSQDVPGNSSLVIAGSLSLASGASSNYGLLTNEGTLTTLAGGTPASGLTNYLDLDNYGTLNNNSTLINNPGGTGIRNFSTLNNNGDLESSGLFENDLILNNNSNSTLTNSGRFNNFGGEVNNETNAAFTNSGTFNNTSDFENHGTLTNSGTFNNAGQIITMGTINNSAGAILNNNSNGLIDNLAGTITNAGTINNSSGEITNFGTLTNFGTITNNGALDNYGTLTNSGAVTISSTGTFTTIGPNSYTQTAGSTLVNGTLTTESGAVVTIQGGTLSGGGTINGDVLTGGTTIAGTPGNPLEFNINGNYEQTGTGVYDELIGSTGNGVLNISGLAMLDPGASLSIDLLGGFDPVDGTNFIIMDYGSESGQFTIGDPFFNNGTQQWVITSYDGGSGNEIVLTAEAATTVPTPEPAGIFLVGLGLLGLGGYARKRRASKAR